MIPQEQEQLLTRLTPGKGLMSVLWKRKRKTISTRIGRLLFVFSVLLLLSVKSTEFEIFLSDDEDSTSVSVSNANRVQSRDSRRIVANGSAPSYPAVRYVAFIQMYVYRHGLLIPAVIEGPGVLLIMMMMRMTRIINRHLRNSWILVMKME